MQYIELTREKHIVGADRSSIKMCLKWPSRMGCHHVVDEQFAPNTLGVYKPKVGEQLLHRFLPHVSEAVGKKLWPVNSFARLVYKGGELRMHYDRPGLDWTLSINIWRDHSWTIEVHDDDGNWHSFEDLGDRAVLMNGRKQWHRRQPFKGREAYQLFLHYSEQPGFEGDPEFKLDYKPFFPKPPKAPVAQSYKVVDCLSDFELEKCLKDSMALTLEAGTMTREGLDTSVRKSEIAFVGHLPEWRWLSDRLAMTAREANDWGIDASGINGVQYTTYGPGSFFNMHNDRAEGTDDRRSLSISALIRNADEGGEFEIDGFGKIPMKPGQAIVFPAWVKHRVHNIEAGYRDSAVMWLENS